MKTTEEKINLLQRVLNVYLLFSKHHSKVKLEYDTNDMTITWYDPKKSWYLFESIVIPIVDIDKRILHYKQKIKTAFSNRHNNK